MLAFLLSQRAMRLERLWKGLYCGSRSKLLLLFAVRKGRKRDDAKCRERLPWSWANEKENVEVKFVRLSRSLSQGAHPSREGPRKLLLSFFFALDHDSPRERERSVFISAREFYFELEGSRARETGRENEKN